MVHGPVRADDFALRAASVLARGVTSAARLRSNPILLTGASGSRVSFVDGRTAVDMVCGLGPSLLGHGHPEVLRDAHKTMDEGVLYGSHPGEILLAERLVDLLPFAEKILFANSGSEAVHAALRIARATTGRRVVVKFEGHYHGWIDPIFVNTQGSVPAPAQCQRIEPRHGVPSLATDPDVVVCRWNDIAQLEAIFEAHRGGIAAVIMEPIPLNFGTFLPSEGYMADVRSACDREGTMLIFDEVLSGFRLALGGASELLDVRPDLAVYAKAIASGFPLAIVAGSEEAMESVVRGEVQPAGTYSGSPVAVAAALATLTLLEEANPVVYQQLDAFGDHLRRGLLELRGLGLPIVVHQIGSVLQIFMDIEEPAQSFADVARSDRRAVATLCEGALDFGAYAVPRGLLLLSAAHSLEDVDVVVNAFRSSAELVLLNGSVKAVDA